MKKEGKIGRLAKAMLVALLVAAVAGCDNMTGGEGEKEGERKVFVKEMRSFKGKLEVGVSDGGAVAVTFSRADGKVFKGEGVVAAKKVSVEAKGEGASEVYHFSGVYEGSGFKETLFGKKGEERAFDFNKEEKEHLFYSGQVTVKGSYRNDEDTIYRVKIAPKSDSEVVMLFENVNVLGSSEELRYEYVGKRSGDAVEAKVRLEGEDFEFKALLNEDGSLRDLTLKGERGYKGNLEPFKGQVYEGKIKGGAGAQAYEGRLQVIVYLSKEALQKGLYAESKEKAWAKKKSKPVNYDYQYRYWKIGELVVRYYDETEHDVVGMLEKRVPFTLGMYKGEYTGEITPAPANSVPTAGDLLAEKGGTNSDQYDPKLSQAVPLKSNVNNSFAVILEGKGWYDADKKSFGSGVLFGRSDMLKALKNVGKATYTIDYATSKARGFTDVAGSLKWVKEE